MRKVVTYITLADTGETLEYPSESAITPPVYQITIKIQELDRFGDASGPVWDYGPIFLRRDSFAKTVKWRTYDKDREPIAKTVDGLIIRLLKMAGLYSLGKCKSVKDKPVKDKSVKD